ncbi:MAG: hypothetical protein V2A77_06705 [Pseudomonadota bacterium]
MEDSPLPFLFEMGVATYYLFNGYTVQFVDLERQDQQARSFDLLVQKADFVAEVECKRTGYDAGKPIHRDVFYRLCDEISKRIAKASGNWFVRLHFSDILPTNAVVHRQLADELRKMIEQHVLVGHMDGVVMKIEELSSDLHFRTMADLDKLRNGDEHIAALWSQDKTILIGARSSKEYKIVENLEARLKEAADQLSKRMPGCIWCYVEGIEDWEWQPLSAGFEGIAMIALDHEDKNHVAVVSYVSEGHIRSFRGAAGTRYRVVRNQSDFVIPADF